MKYKVIKIIDNGVVAVNKNNIICFYENCLSDEDGDSLEVYPGMILTEKMHKNADIRWAYSKKEWTILNAIFEDIQRNGF